MVEGRVEREVETSIFLVVAFETGERAGKVYEMFRDTVRDQMRQICEADPKLSKLPARQVFFEMCKRWLGLDPEQAKLELVKLAKVAAFLELTSIGEGDMGLATRQAYEAAGKSAWSFYLAQRDSKTEG